LDVIPCHWFVYEETGRTLFLLFVFYIFVFADQSSRLNVEKERITISTVAYEPFQEFIPITGSILPIKTFYLDVSDGGRVVKKFVEEGAFVNVGDPIIKLDNAALTLNIMYNEAQLFQQINNLRSTRLSMEQNRLNLQEQILQVQYDLIDKKREYEVNKELFNKNLISENEFKRSKEQYDFLVNKKALTLESFKQDSAFFRRQLGNEWFSQKPSPFSTQHDGRRQIEIENFAFGVEGQITDRREIIEVCIAVTGFFQPRLGFAQFAVLDLQFDLVHMKFVQQELYFIEALFGGGRA